MILFKFLFLYHYSKNIPKIYSILLKINKIFIHFQFKKEKRCERKICFLKYFSMSRGLLDLIPVISFLFKIMFMSCIKKTNVSLNVWNLKNVSFKVKITVVQPNHTEDFACSD